MEIQAEAQIYLSSQRGVTESLGIRSTHTFNFGSYQHADRQPFGNLLVWNEEVLAPGKRIAIHTNKPTDIFILPLIGGVEIMDSQGESVFVDAGESFNFLSFPESGFELINPYPVEVISYLQIHSKPSFSLTNFGLDDNEGYSVFSLEEKNRLVPVFEGGSESVNGFMGKYDGREDGTYQLKHPDNGLYVYIIEGAFEVANRLLEKGDALSLKHLEIVEFEALSNNAIILLVEVML